MEHCWKNIKESRWKVLGGVTAILLVVVAGTAAQQQLGDGSVAVSLPLDNISSPPRTPEFIVLPDSPEEFDSPENILDDDISREVPLLIPIGPVVSLSGNGGFEQFHGGIELDDLLPEIDDLTLEQDSLEAVNLAFVQPDSSFPIGNGFSSSGPAVAQPVGVPLIATGPQVPQNIGGPNQPSNIVEVISTGIPLSNAGPQFLSNGLGPSQNIAITPDNYPVTDENAGIGEPAPAEGTGTLEATPEIYNEILTDQTDDSESVTEAIFIDIGDGEEDVSQVSPTSPAAEVEQVMAELAAAAPEQKMENDTITSRAMSSAEPVIDPPQEDSGLAMDELEVVTMPEEDMAVIPEVIAEDAFTGEVYREDVLPEEPEISEADLEKFFVADDPQAAAAEEELGKDVEPILQQLPEDQLDIAPLPDIVPYTPEDDSDVIDESPVAVIVPDYGDDVSINEVIEETGGELVPIEDEPINEPPILEIVTEVPLVVPEEEILLIDEAPAVEVPVPETPVYVASGDDAPEVNEVVDYDTPVVTSVDDLVAIMGDFGEKLPDDIDIRVPILEDAPAPVPEIDSVAMFDPAPVTESPPPPPPPPPPPSSIPDPIIFPDYSGDPLPVEYPEYVMPIEDFEPIVEVAPPVTIAAPAPGTDVLDDEDIMMMMNFDAAPLDGSEPAGDPIPAPAPAEVPVLPPLDPIIPDPVTEPVPVVVPETPLVQMPVPASPIAGAPSPAMDIASPVKAPAPAVETAPPVEAPVPAAEVDTPVMMEEMFGHPKPNLYEHKPTTKAPSHKPTAPYRPYRPATSHFHYKEPKPEHHKPNFVPSSMYGAPTPSYKSPPYKPPAHPRPTHKPPSYGYPSSKPSSYSHPPAPKSTTMSYGPPPTTPPSPYKSRPTYMSYKPSPPSYKAPQTYKAPSHSYKAPSPAYKAPASSYLPPPPTYKAPSLPYKAPQPTYKAPPPTYKPPSPPYKPPQPTYKAPPPPSTYKPTSPPSTYKPPPSSTYKPPPPSTTVKSEKPTSPAKPILAPLLIPAEPSGIHFPETQNEGPYGIWNIPAPASRRQRLQVPDSVVHLLNAPQPEWVSSLEPER
ncbi:proteoglycan 4-like [Palaemon carinicauda]|uniref:proteoglycan 4-like n=1 Tax=Palaemon carinicauda TaxID=392227 RepID=UPI0035B6803C